MKSRKIKVSLNVLIILIFGISTSGIAALAKSQTDRDAQIINQLFRLGMYTGSGNPSFILAFYGFL